MDGDLDPVGFRRAANNLEDTDARAVAGHATDLHSFETGEALEERVRVAEDATHQALQDFEQQQMLMASLRDVRGRSL